MYKAAPTSAAGISGAIVQPTVLRECKSRTATRHSQPLRDLYADINQLA
jgi:hypothetical protein